MQVVLGGQIPGSSGHLLPQAPTKRDRPIASANTIRMVPVYHPAAVGRPFTGSRRHLQAEGRKQAKPFWGTEWDPAPERFSRLSPTCNPLLPPPTLAPDLPKLDVVGSNPISRFQGVGRPPCSRTPGRSETFQQPAASNAPTVRPIQVNRKPNLQAQ